jgi:hypothetical protein
MTDDTIKQIFLYVDDKNPKAVYADNVNIIDFARKIIEVAKEEIKEEEHARCVKIVSHMNREVARALEGQKP